mmetsp:Transcript_108582/g.188571  ORF Transcript_108582/g.188571 Transcript_108582/m.188571 type:complete len:237 (-) Transcript_108582:62-772(-)
MCGATQALPQLHIAPGKWILAAMCFSGTAAQWSSWRSTGTHLMPKDSIIALPGDAARLLTTPATITRRMHIMRHDATPSFSRRSAVSLVRSGSDDDSAGESAGTVCSLYLNKVDLTIPKEENKHLVSSCHYTLDGGYHMIVQFSDDEGEIAEWNKLSNITKDNFVTEPPPGRGDLWKVNLGFDTSEGEFTRIGEVFEGYTNFELLVRPGQYLFLRGWHETEGKKDYTWQVGDTIHK